MGPFFECKGSGNFKYEPIYGTKRINQNDNRRFTINLSKGKYILSIGATCAYYGGGNSPVYPNTVAASFNEIQRGYGEPFEIDLDEDADVTIYITSFTNASAIVFWTGIKIL